MSTRNTVEFGPSVALPLKEAIAQTEGVTLVSIAPARGAITHLKLGIGPKDRGSALVPGEVLFVGFDRPNYGFDVMNRAIAEVAGKIAVGETSIQKAEIYGGLGVRLGSITFNEEGQIPIVGHTITTFAAEDAFLRGLLKDIGLEVGQGLENMQSYVPERTTYAVFYPSRLFAAVAGNFGGFLEADQTTPRYEIHRPEHIFGAMTVMLGRDFQRLAVAYDEREALGRVFSGYHPNYIIPESLTV